MGLFFIVSFANAEDTSTPPNESITPSTSTSSHEGEMREKHLTSTLERKLNADIDSLKNSKDEKRITVNSLKAGNSSLTGKIVGTVTANDGSTLTVKNESKILTVTTDTSTKCERHYFGTCAISEIAINDKVQVFGNYSDATKTTLQATLIRDVSIMKKYGAFIGNVVSKTDSSFIIESKERGQQTILVTTTTKFVQRNEKPSTFAALQVGNRVRVKGVWDKVNKTVSLVTQVKNYSLPPLPSTVPHMPPGVLSPTVEPTTDVSPTETPTVSVSPTDTPTPTGVSQ